MEVWTKSMFFPSADVVAAEKRSSTSTGADACTQNDLAGTFYDWYPEFQIKNTMEGVRFAA